MASSNRDYSSIGPLGTTNDYLRNSAIPSMHLQFHYYFEKDLIIKIGREKFGDLKEALTILLNEEFRDLWIVEDKGYEIHQELRKRISEQWKKNKDFDELIRLIAR